MSDASPGHLWSVNDGRVRGNYEAGKKQGFDLTVR